MNANKIFRIFASDLQEKRDKKFVGVVETVPPNNVITLTVPTLKKAFVFSAHDPMKINPEAGEDLCVRFSGTLTIDGEPSEVQEFLFYFSTDIKKAAFIKEANSLMEAAKTTGRGSTEKAVIRRNSLINSDGKLKTGNLLKRFAKVPSILKTIQETDKAQSKDGERKEETEAEKQQEPAAVPAEVVEETQSTNLIEPVVPKKEKQNESVDNSGYGAEQVDGVGKPAAETVVTDVEPAQDASEESDSEDSSTGEDGVEIEEQQRTAETSEGSPAETSEGVADVAVAEKPAEATESGKQSTTSFDQLLAAASVIVDARTSESEKVQEEEEEDDDDDDEQEEQEEQEESVSGEEMTIEAVTNVSQRYRSSLDNRDVTRPSFYQIPDSTEGETQRESTSESRVEDDDSFIKTSSLDNIDVTKPNFFEIPDEDNANMQEQGSPRSRSHSGHSDDLSGFDEFLFQENTGANDNGQDGMQEESPLSLARIDSIPEEMELMETDSSGEDHSPPPIRLTRSNRRASALRHSFTAVPSLTRGKSESMITHADPYSRNKSESMITHADPYSRNKSESMITHADPYSRNKSESMITHADPQSRPQSRRSSRVKSESMITHADPYSRSKSESMITYADPYSRPQSRRGSRNKSESMITHADPQSRRGSRSKDESIIQKAGMERWLEEDVEDLEDLEDLEPPPLPSPSESEGKGTKVQARVERLRSSVIEGLNRAVNQDKIESSYVTGVENLLKIQQDRIKELESEKNAENFRLRELSKSPYANQADPRIVEEQEKNLQRVLQTKEREFERALQQRDGEYQDKIDNLIAQQTKKELKIQENLAGEMHDMRRDYEKRIDKLEQQLRSDEGERLRQIREEYDHMRHTMQEDFDRHMAAREGQIRADEAAKLQQLRDGYESKVEDQLSLKLEYENKIGKLIDQFKAEEAEKLEKVREEYERKIDEQRKRSEENDVELVQLKKKHEEKVKNMESKYQSLSKTFQALKNHELNLQTKASAKSAQIELKKLQTILSLMWNMLSTVDNEIAHFENLELPQFDWDKHVISIHGIEKDKKFELPSVSTYGNPIINPPPLSSPAK